MTVQPPRRSFFQLFVWFWAPVLFYVAIIFTLSAQPNLKPPVDFENADKWCHMIEYGGLGILMARALRATARLRLAVAGALLVLVIGVGIAAGDEYFQSFVPGRDSSFFDWMADATGLLLAQMLFLLFTRD